MQIENKTFESIVSGAWEAYRKERDVRAECRVDGFSEGLAFGRLLVLRSVASAAGECGLVDWIDRILDGEEAPLPVAEVRELRG